MPQLLATVLALVLAAGCGPAGATATAPTPADTTELPDPASVGPFADEADYQAQRAGAEAALEMAIGDAEAADVASCRVVPTSEQACGGPASFAVYSAAAPEADRAERAAALLVALDKQANAQFDRVSTCQAYIPPTPALRDGRCATE